MAAQRRRLLPLVLSALLLLLLSVASTARGEPDSTDTPADVAARWSRLDPKRWSLRQLVEALPLLEPPDGFEVSLYHPSKLLDNARSLALSGASRHPGGPVIVYVSTKLANKTYALVDADGDGVAERATTLVDGVDTPQGLDWRDGDLYVSGWRGGKGFVWRLPAVDAYALRGERYPFEAAAQVVTSSLPGDRWHGERYMRFGPDGLLYVSIGAPCDACAERTSPEGVVFASIYSLNVSEGGDRGLRLFARGLRNVVGIDWHPDRPRDAYFTTNGRDGLGDDRPDCTLARADVPGLNFGFPYCHQVGDGDPYLRALGPGRPLPDPQLNARGSALNCSLRRSYRRPVQALGPHVAPLGLRFYRWDAASGWPRRYDRAAIVAEHGSWDRSSKIGYRLALVRVDYGDGGGGGTAGGNGTAGGSGGGGSSGAPRAVAHEAFVTGWVGGKPGDPKASQVSWGRPADVLQLPDGSLLVSDDGAHTVYRLHYTGRSKRSRRGAPPASPNHGGEAKARSSRAALLFCVLLAAAALLQPL